MSTTLQQLPAATYAVDPIHSSVGFGVQYNKLATFRTVFDSFDAQLADGVLTGTADARSIRGQHTLQARKALGASLYDEVIHRDNLVLIL